MTRTTKLPGLCGLVLFSLTSCFGQTGASAGVAGPIIRILRPQGDGKIVRPLADGLDVSYTIGGPSPIVVTTQVQSSFGAAPFTVSQTGGTWLSVSPTSGTTPATLTLTITPVGLAVGTYTASYTVSTSVTTGGETYTGTDTSTITLTVSAAPPDVVSVSPSSVSFSGTAGQTVAPQSVTITTSGSVLGYSASASASWLTVSPASGTTDSSISILASTTGLAAGTYNSGVTIFVAGGTPSSITIPVSFTVAAAAQTSVNVLLSPTSLSFSGTVGQSVPPQTFTLSSSPSSTNFTVVTPSVTWLSVSPSSGSTGGTTGSSITATVNPAGLAAGTYTTNLTISVPGGTPSSFTLPVTYTVSPAPAVPLTSPGSGLALSFSYVQGSSTLPAPQTFNVAAGNSNLAFSASASVPWINVSHSSGGTLPDTETITVTPGTMAPGTYQGNVSYQVTGASPSSFTVAVTLTITAAPTPAVTVLPGSLSFSAQVNGSSPAPGSITIQLPPNSPALSFTASANVPWLTVNPASGSAPGSIQVIPSATGLTAGTLTGTVTISVPGGNPASIAVPVTFVLTATPPTVVSPSAISLTGQAGQPPSGSPASIYIQTASTTPVAYTVTPPSGAPWLILTGSLSGTVSAGSPVSISVSADPTQGSLAAGTYSATVSITSAGQTSTVPVSFTVSPAPAPLSIDKSTLTFTAAAGTTPTPAQVVNLTTNPGSLAFSVNGLPSWLTVSNSGSGSQALSFVANPSGLAAGAYQATVTISAGSASVAVTVNLTVVAPNAPTFTPAPSPLSLTQNLSVAPQAPVSATLQLTGLTAGANYSLVTFTATAQPSGSWLTVSPVNTSSVPFTVTVYANSTGLQAGTYTGTITISSQAATTVTQTEPVTFTVTPNNNSYTIYPTTLQENGVAGGAASTDSITVAAAAAGLSYTAVSNQPWITITSGSSGTMPGTIGLSISPSTLTSGTYSGTITITATGPSGTVLTAPVQTATVDFTVGAPTPPIPTATSATTNFTSAMATQTQTIATVNITGAGALQITAATSTPWLNLVTSSLSLGGSNPSSGVVTANLISSAIPATPGSYAGSYTLSTSAGVFFTGMVALQVTSSNQIQFTVSPPAASAVSAVNINSPLFLPLIFVENSGTSALPFSVSSNQSWLTATPTSGTAPAGGSVTLTPQVNQTAFTAPGNYNGTLTIHPTAASDTTLDQIFTVAVQVEPASTAGASVNLNPPVHSGPPSGGTISYSIEINNATGGSLPFTAGTTSYGSVPLLAGTITPASGTVPAGSSQTLTLTATAPAANGLSGGTAVVNLGGTAFTDNYSYLGLPGLSPSAVGPDGQPQPRAACTPSTLYVLPTSPQQNSVDTVGSPIAIEVLVADNCGNPLTSGNVTATFSSGDPSLVLTAANGQGLWTGTWVPTATTGASVAIAINAQTATTGGITGTAKLQVGLNLTPIGPVVPPASVVSSADFSTPDSGAPGSILSIFGENLASGTASLTGLPLPTTLLDTSVTLGTTPLYLYFVSPTQINAFVPYNFTPGTTPQLVVSRSGNNTTSVPLTVYINPLAPSLFLLNGNATRPGIVVDYRGSQNFVVGSTTPVMAGDTVVLYCLGLGQVTQSVGADQPAPSSPLAQTTNTVTATIGGVNAPVIFAGLTPGTVGLYQVNVQVPTGIQAGNAVPVVITIGGQSNIPVTIPVAAQ